MLRLVLDTNVFISAYEFGGRPADLMRALIGGDARLVTSAAILAETARVLTRHGSLTPQRVEEIVRELIRISDVATPGARLAVVADEADNRVLECAMAGEADAVVSGDAHVLGLGSYEGIRMLTVAEALGELEEGRQP